MGHDWYDRRSSSSILLRHGWLFWTDGRDSPFTFSYTPYSCCAPRMHPWLTPIVLSLIEMTTEWLLFPSRYPQGESTVFIYALLAFLVSSAEESIDRKWDAVHDALEGKKSAAGEMYGNTRSLAGYLVWLLALWWWIHDSTFTFSNGKLKFSVVKHQKYILDSLSSQSKAVSLLTFCISVVQILKSGGWEHHSSPYEQQKSSCEIKLVHNCIASRYLW